MKKIVILIAILMITLNLLSQTNLKEVTPRNHKITLSEANEYTARYEAVNELTENSPVEFNFDLVQVKIFINEVNGKWFNIKKGMDKQGNENVVLSILDASAILVGTYALQTSYPCPPWCN